MLTRGEHISGDAIGISVQYGWLGVGVLGFAYQLLDEGTLDATDQEGNVIGSFTLRNHLAVMTVAASLGDRLHLGANLKYPRFELGCRGQCPEGRVRSSSVRRGPGCARQTPRWIPLDLGSACCTSVRNFETRRRRRGPPFRLESGRAGMGAVETMIEEERLAVVVSLDVEDRLRDPGEPAVLLGAEFSAGTDDRVYIRGGYTLVRATGLEGAAAGLRPPAGSIRTRNRPGASAGRHRLPAGTRTPHPCRSILTAGAHDLHRRTSPIWTPSARRCMPPRGTPQGEGAGPGARRADPAVPPLPGPTPVELESSGDLYRNRSQRYAVPSEIHLVVGKLQVVRSGDAFLRPEEPGRMDIYVAQRHLESAMDGDRVAVRVEGTPSGGRNPVGRVVKILGRARPTVVGRYQATRKFGFVTPLDRRIGGMSSSRKARRGPPDPGTSSSSASSSSGMRSGTPSARWNRCWVPWRRRASMSSRSSTATDFRRSFPPRWRKRRGMPPSAAAVPGEREDLRDHF
jgi:hypothetical protein